MIEFGNNGRVGFAIVAITAHPFAGHDEIVDIDQFSFHSDYLVFDLFLSVRINARLTINPETICHTPHQAVITSIPP